MDLECISAFGRIIEAEVHRILEKGRDKKGGEATLIKPIATMHMQCITSGQLRFKQIYCDEIHSKAQDVAIFSTN